MKQTERNKRVSRKIIRKYFNSQKEKILLLEGVKNYKKLSRIGKVVYRVTQKYNEELLKLF